MIGRLLTYLFSSCGPRPICRGFSLLNWRQGINFSSYQVLWSNYQPVNIHTEEPSLGPCIWANWPINPNQGDFREDSLTLHHHLGVFPTNAEIGDWLYCAQIYLGHMFKILQITLSPRLDKHTHTHKIHQNCVYKLVMN